MEEQKPQKQAVPIDRAIPIVTSIDTDFFRWWLEFLKPIHKMTSSQMDVMAEFLKQRHKLSEVITDPELLDKLTLSGDVRKQVRESCEMTQTHFQVIMSSLRKNGVIKDGKIISKLIPPNLTQDSTNFRLLIYFKLK